MRLATIQTWAGPRAAVLRGDNYVDVHATDPEIPPSVHQILEGGAGLLRAAEEVAARPGAMVFEAAKVKFYSPVPDPRKIVCVGLNYRDHAAESGAPSRRTPSCSASTPPPSSATTPPSCCPRSAARSISRPSWSSSSAKAAAT